mmetsp:Transcript_21611/g.34889  ORF Transcript_21611/g.34889 Transcript_21611/m.34889 type:complete len:85 (-) Transcript_21611:824-1078(-)
MLAHSLFGYVVALGAGFAAKERRANPEKIPRTPQIMEWCGIVSLASGSSVLATTVAHAAVTGCEAVYAEVTDPSRFCAAMEFNP